MQLAGSYESFHEGLGSKKEKDSRRPDFDHFSQIQATGKAVGCYSEQRVLDNAGFRRCFQEAGIEGK